MLCLLKDTEGPPSSSGPQSVGGEGYFPVGTGHPLLLGFLRGRLRSSSPLQGRTRGLGREEGSRFGGWGWGTLASSSVPGSCWLPAPCQQTCRTAEDMLGKQAKPSLRLVLLSPPSLPEDSELLGPASNVPICGSARQIPV